MMTNKEFRSIKTQYGDGVFAQIRWSIWDLEEVFNYYNVKFTKENVEKFLATRVARGIEDYSVEAGWDILDDFVGSAVQDGVFEERDD